MCCSAHIRFTGSFHSSFVPILQCPRCPDIEIIEEVWVCDHPEYLTANPWLETQYSGEPVTAAPSSEDCLDELPPPPYSPPRDPLPTVVGRDLDRAIPPVSAQSTPLSPPAASHRRAVTRSRTLPSRVAGNCATVVSSPEESS